MLSRLGSCLVGLASYVVARLGRLAVMLRSSLNLFQDALLVII